MYYGPLPLIPNMNHSPIFSMIGGVLEFIVIIMLLIYYTANFIVSCLVVRNLLHSTTYI